MIVCRLTPALGCKLAESQMGYLSESDSVVEVLREAFSAVVVDVDGH